MPKEVLFLPKKIRVSDLKYFPICPKRSKIQSMKITKIPEAKGEAIVRGTEIHNDLYTQLKSFDRQIVLYKLWELEDSMIFDREVDGVIIAGKFDDVRVLNHYKHGKLTKKSVVMIEHFTTTWKKCPYWMKKIKAFQLELYYFIMIPYFKAIGWELEEHGYVEIFNQDVPPKLMERIRISFMSSQYYESYIKGIFDCWLGLKPMQYPTSRWICRNCPRTIKEECGYWFRWKTL